MDNRRQSGLWGRNAQTDQFEHKNPPPGSSAPYQYYQPPRRSFSARAANTDVLGDANGVARGDTSADMNDFADKTTFSPSLDAKQRHSMPRSEELANTDDENIASSPTIKPLEPSYDDDLDDIPINLRTKPWSPEPMEQPATQDTARPTRQASDASTMVRRNSVPHRSPLQKLEGQLDGISKEEKRARVEQAEDRARKTSLSGHGKSTTAGEDGMQRANTLRSGKGRVVSDGSRRSVHSASDLFFQDSPRDVSTGEPLVGTSREAGSARPSDGLRISTSTRTAPDEAVSSPLSRPDPGLPERQTSNRQRQDPPIIHNPRPYHHAPSTPRDLGISQRSSKAGNPSATRSIHQRNGSVSHDRHLQQPGLAGAAAATAIGYEISAADRGKAAHERRKSLEQSKLLSGGRSPQMGGSGVARAESRKLPKRDPTTDSNNDIAFDNRSQAQPGPLSSSRGTGEPEAPSDAYQKRDSPSRAQHVTMKKKSPSHPIPPQTETGKQARKQVGFHETSLATAAGVAGASKLTNDELTTTPHEKHHKLRDMFHHDEPRQSHIPSGIAFDEWRSAQIAKLDLADLEFDAGPPQPATKPKGKNAAWWEGNTGDRRTTSSDPSQSPVPEVAAAQLDGPYEEAATMFKPQLFLKCGPLLRFTGIRREKGSETSTANGRAVWRGTVMIVTEDAQSDLSSPPTLRLFAQPMDILQFPSKEALAQGQDMSPELEDPLAGQMKVSRTGRPIYVRPVHEIEGGVDLSLTESNEGLYSASRTPMLGPQNSSMSAIRGDAGRQRSRITFQDKNRIKRRDGEKAGRHKDVKAVRLYTDRGFTFWRFGLEIELGSSQHRVAYRINSGPALGFWVPGRAESMNVMFHSCNGFSLSVDPSEFSGPDPLWRDVLSKHQFRPFHVMVGGGDQIYNDAVMRDTKLFGEWIRMKNPEHKHRASFTPEMQDELEQFYLHHYAMWFSQGLFSMAASQIPMVNIWDDHDIIDGYGSYPHRFMASKVFTGLGAVAYKYYMLFQHQSLVAETSNEEPSWILGSSPGPYINELSRNLFLDLGPHLKFLGIDCRTERMRDEVVSQETYELLFQRCEKEIQKGETKHLIVLLGVPIAYPRLNFLENILTSRVMDPIKAIGRTGMLGGFVNKFDGGVEILDDLDDHWTAKHHKGERNWFIQELQEFAIEKSVRITFLGGDVHLAAVGQFYTPRRFGLSKDSDHRYMPNVISSAIVNTPPPAMMADVLNRRNKVHHLDSATDEDLIPMFEHDVEGSRRNNKCLLPRRNYCTIREFLPGNTPPSTPDPADQTQMPPTPGSVNSIQDEGLWSTRRPDDSHDRRFPPGSMRRTMSLTRSGASSLIRRLSGSGKGRNIPSQTAPRRSMSDRPQFFGQTASDNGRSKSLSNPPPEAGDSYFPPPAPSGETSERPTFRFHRRPTNFSEREIRKAMAKGGAPPDEENADATVKPPIGHINLEGGLDISLNVELNQHDPAGHTQGYRLLVPALFCDGKPDGNATRLKAGRTSFIQRLSSVRRRKQIEDERDDGHRSRSPSPSVNQQVQEQQAYQSQQQQQQPQQQQDPSFATRTTSTGATDGAYDQRNAVAAATRHSIDATHTHGPSYDRGYNLSGPPIGAAHFAPPNGPEPALHSPSWQPQPRTRTQIRSSQPDRQARVSGGVFDYGRDAGQYSEGEEGSLLPSEEEDGEEAQEDEERDGPLSPLEQDFSSSPPQRPSNKAERFFGVGDAPVPGRTAFAAPAERANSARKKKPAWKIWGQ